ncbi:DivIVA domain-containing protein [Actinoplanes sp. NPDC024001]|uniref:DivIVA domain-containing protein n=1 Tax=Actinoplanes sp. NPDC024001 TaxID=3154598 RepID=UPI003409B2D5
MRSDFTVALRGYDREQVDRLLAEVDAALAAPEPALHEAARQLLRKPELQAVLRGYACDEVEDAIRDRLRLLEPAADPTASLSGPGLPSFTVVLRGYDITQVDEAFQRCEAAQRSDDAFARATARDMLRTANFTVRWRGYARTEVDGAVQQLVRQLSS